MDQSRATCARIQSPSALEAELHPDVTITADLVLGADACAEANIPGSISSVGERPGDVVGHPVLGVDGHEQFDAPSGGSR